MPTAALHQRRLLQIYLIPTMKNRIKGGYATSPVIAERIQIVDEKCVLFPPLFRISLTCYATGHTLTISFVFFVLVVWWNIFVVPNSASKLRNRAYMTLDSRVISLPSSVVRVPGRVSFVFFLFRFGDTVKWATIWGCGRCACSVDSLVRTRNQVTVHGN
jgi:hypothetical protein